jgi:hypothetical protein
LRTSSRPAHAAPAIRVGQTILIPVMDRNRVWPVDANHSASVRLRGRRPVGLQCHQPRHSESLLPV